MKSGPKPKPVDERLWALVSALQDGCWIWTGSCYRNGYGQFSIRINGRSKKLLAHRVSYELLIGPVPSGLELDHLCRNRTCVNPTHLEPVTHQENCHRGLKGQQTRCHRGHLLEGANVRWKTATRRNCVKCERIREAARPHWKERLRLRELVEA